MSKKKNEIECDECGHKCTISHKEKQSISHCPFCGEQVAIKDSERPLLNNFDSLDEFEEENYYDDEENEAEDD